MICFALLAHENEHLLLQQIRNIRKYNPKKALIVLYNGGNNPDFGKAICKKENVLYCPYSKPLEQRTSGRFLYDVMKWLEITKVKYEYLVYMEYDIAFVNYGFGRLLSNQMKGYDCLVKILKKESNPMLTTWEPGQEMWRDWKRWKPFFGVDHFYRTSSPMSVFRHGIIKRILAGINTKQLEYLFQTSSIRCIGEMVYITLCKRFGGKCTTYKKSTREYLRFRPALTLKELRAAKRKPNIIFVHPVKAASLRKWVFKQ
ncbi:hypothetical protein PaeBR_06245 [Paenibacillus sp. BR2-3]|uniref:hypothetical protein n=1 Tax=Paenibacillus sp. BR2-3 TaxID=3048494 RepID=UPI003977D6F1